MNKEIMPKTGLDIIFTITMLVLAFAFIAGFFFMNNAERSTHFNQKMFTEEEIFGDNVLGKSLDIILTNCGTTHIVKRDKDYFVFVQKCKGAYCKYDYVPLEDCFK